MKKNTSDPFVVDLNRRIVSGGVGATLAAAEWAVGAPGAVAACQAAGSLVAAAWPNRHESREPGENPHKKVVVMTRHKVVGLGQAFKRVAFGSIAGAVVGLGAVTASGYLDQWTEDRPRPAEFVPPPRWSTL